MAIGKKTFVSGSRESVSRETLANELRNTNSSIWSPVWMVTLTVYVQLKP